MAAAPSGELITYNTKGAVLLLQLRWAVHPLFLGFEQLRVGGYVTEVCSAWPLRWQTYGYLPRQTQSVAR